MRQQELCMCLFACNKGALFCPSDQELIHAFRVLSGRLNAQILDWVGYWPALRDAVLLQNKRDVGQILLEPHGSSTVIKWFWANGDGTSRRS